MKYGYAYITPADQGSDKLQALRRAGCQALYMDDGIAGGAPQRPELARCVQSLQRGDVLVIPRLAGLAGNLPELIETINDLGNRGIGLLSLADAINTAAPGNLIYHLVSVLAKFTDAVAFEKARPLKVAVRARGNRRGPKVKLSLAQIGEARQLIDEGQSCVNVADLFEVNRVTLYARSKRTSFAMPEANGNSL
jgi:DNA invertase Pin-like site-specific DNA recombinase